MISFFRLSFLLARSEFGEAWRLLGIKFCMSISSSFSLIALLSSGLPRTRRTHAIYTSFSYYTPIWQHLVKKSSDVITSTFFSPSNSGKTWIISSQPNASLTLMLLESNLCATSMKIYSAMSSICSSVISTSMSMLASASQLFKSTCSPSSSL